MEYITFCKFGFRACSALGDGLHTFHSVVKVNLTTVNQPRHYKKDVLGEDDMVILTTTWRTCSNGKHGEPVAMENMENPYPCTHVHIFSIDGENFTGRMFHLLNFCIV